MKIRAKWNSIFESPKEEYSAVYSSFKYAVIVSLPFKNKIRIDHSAYPTIKTPHPTHGRIRYLIGVHTSHSLILQPVTLSG
jgi:hypothetical protein